MDEVLGDGLTCYYITLKFTIMCQRTAADLLEARHDVASDGADQRRDVVHEALGEAVLPGRLQPLGEVQVVDDALHLS